MIIQYTVEGVHSWKRDKVTARGGRARTYRPDGDAEAKQAHANAFVDAECAMLLSDDAPSQDDYGAKHQWAVHVIYSPANERAHDTDRVLTLVLDALTGVVWHDDSDKFVVDSRCRVDRSGAYAPGTTTVTIERVAGPYVAAKKSRAKKVAS